MTSVAANLLFKRTDLSSPGSDGLALGTTSGGGQSGGVAALVRPCGRPAPRDPGRVYEVVRLIICNLVLAAVAAGAWWASAWLLTRAGITWPWGTRRLAHAILLFATIGAGCCQLRSGSEAAASTWRRGDLGLAQKDLGAGERHALASTATNFRKAVLRRPVFVRTRSSAAFMAAVVRRLEIRRGKSARACSRVAGSSGVRCRRDSISSVHPNTCGRDPRPVAPMCRLPIRLGRRGWVIAEPRAASDAPLGCRGRTMGTPLTGVSLRRSSSPAGDQQRSALGVEKSELHAHPVGSVRLGWVELAHPSHAARTHKTGDPWPGRSRKRIHLAHGPRFAAGQEKHRPGSRWAQKRATNASKSGVAQLSRTKAGAFVATGKSSIGLRAQGVNRIMSSTRTVSARFRWWPQPRARDASTEASASKVFTTKHGSLRFPRKGIGAR